MHGLVWEILLFQGSGKVGEILLSFGLQNSTLPTETARTLGGAATLQEKGEEKLVPHLIENGNKQRNGILYGMGGPSSANAD